MKRSIGKWLTLLCCLTLLAAMAISSPAPVLADELDVTGLYKSKDVTETWNDAETVNVLLTGGVMACDSANVKLDGAVMGISAAGTYRLSGELTGRIEIDVDKNDDVRLILDGLTVQSPEGPALYVRSADKVILTLVKDTVNTFGDAMTLTEGEDTVSSALYSKDDLSINGEGALTVNGNVKNGIVCKNDLIIANGDITVNSVNDGIRGKDSLLVLGGMVAVTAGGDGLISDNDVEGELGIVTLAGGSLTLNCGGGAGEQQASEQDWGRYGGWEDWSEDEDTASMKGVKATGEVRIADGLITIDSADDALHSAKVTVLGGTSNLRTGDDGIHADELLAIQGGVINIEQSYEGLEAASIEISGGEISVVASDDGLNAAGGADSSAMNGGWGGRNDRFAAGDYAIRVSGGTLRVNAQGDGIDSNGDIAISGGLTYVSGPTNSGNGALDYAGQCEVTGGTIALAGASGMMQNVTASSGQATLLVYLDASQQAQTPISLCDAAGGELIAFTPQKQYDCVLVSTPAMQTGSQYTLLCGGVSQYSDTLSQDVSSNGGDMGGFGGGFGGFGGGREGRPGGGGRR